MSVTNHRQEIPRIQHRINSNVHTHVHTHIPRHNIFKPQIKEKSWKKPEEINTVPIGNKDKNHIRLPRNHINKKAVE